MILVAPNASFIYSCRINAISNKLHKRFFR